MTRDVPKRTIKGSVRKHGCQTLSRGNKRKPKILPAEISAFWCAPRHCRRCQPDWIHNVASRVLGSVHNCPVFCQVDSMSSPRRVEFDTIKLKCVKKQSAALTSKAVCLGSSKCRAMLQIIGRVGLRGARPLQLKLQCQS